MEVKSQKSKVKSGVIGIFLCLVLAGPIQLYAQDQIVAVVNKEVITEKDLVDFASFLHLQLSRQYQGSQLQEKMETLIPGLLEKLIEDRLILQQAAKSNVTVEDAIVRGRIDEIRRNYDSDEQFQADLRNQGLVPADLEKRSREQIMSMRLIDEEVRSRIQVQPEEVTRFYQEHPDKFAPAEERLVDMVTCEHEATAVSAAHDLRRAIALADVQKRYPVTASALTVRQGGDFRPDIQDIVFKLKEGEVSPPLWIDGQYYVFRLNEIIHSERPALQSVRDQIFAYLSQKKFEDTFKEWMDELKAKAYIRVMEAQ